MGVRMAENALEHFRALQAAYKNVRARSRDEEHKWRCPKCGSQNSVSANRCRKCGL